MMNFNLRNFLVAVLVGSGGAWPVSAQEPPTSIEAAKKVLAPLDGTVTLPGLKQPVAVHRDRWGIAHIYAGNAHDLFFAQGYVVAQDRLFQIDLWRRQGIGEMAEVFGPNHEHADRFARLMKYRGDPAAEWESYAPDTRMIATAFTAGINAGIDQFGDRLPVEFTRLGYRPKKWRPEDVLGRMSGITMSRNFRSEILRAKLVAAVGIEKARQLAPVDPPIVYESALRPEELKAINDQILAGYTAAIAPPAIKPSPTESNNWVVSGERSMSGKPLLASDPHRAITIPSLRYLVHLNAPDWDVIGAGEPGLPGVAIGHNQRIAWGFTIIGTDQADLYVEETNPNNPLEYRTETGWSKMTIVREDIPVKGSGNRSVDLKFTRHGPVIAEDPARHRVYALKWVGHEPGGAAYLASLSVDRAGTWEEFQQALSRWKVPGLNFVYADIDGNIGWIAAARTPIRPRHDGLLPVPGDGRFEWSGYLSVKDYPQTFNPSAGWTGTANHNIVPPGYPHRIGHEFSPAYRFDRVRDTLAARQKWDLAGFGKLQHDAVSIPGQTLARMLKGVSFTDPTLAAEADRFAAWDGELGRDSPIGPLYAAWLPILQERFYAGHGTESQVPLLISLNGLQVVLNALETNDPDWLGPDPQTTRNAILRESFSEAVRRRNRLPATVRTRWGDLHTATFRHPLERAFDVGPFPRAGDGNTPLNTRYDANYKQVHGATYRHLLDLADWDRGLATSAPGQSGQPGSPHYADLAPLWARGEYFPLAYSKQKVESVTAHRLTLQPMR